VIGNNPGPSFTAEEAELVVFYGFGRWFAAWKALDELDRPEDSRIEVVRILLDSSTPSGLLFREV
jgi:hypothetical protein